MTLSSFLGARDVSGRVVLITGAGNGIGAEAARRLVRGGASVALLDSDESAVTRLARELGDRAEACTVDVTDPEAIRTAVDAAVRRFGGIDVVMANAGITGPAATVSAIDAVDFERVVAVNLVGVFHTVRAVLPHLFDRRGYVLVTSSIAAAIPGPTMSAYMASKAGVESFARSLRIELSGTGVGVGVAYFGLIDTGMAAGLLSADGLGVIVAALPPFVRKPAPVGTAADAIIFGISRRSQRMYAPWWVRLALELRPALALADPFLARMPAVRAVQG